MHQPMTPVTWATSKNCHSEASGRRICFLLTTKSGFLASLEMTILELLEMPIRNSVESTYPPAMEMPGIAAMLTNATQRQAVSS